MTTPNTPLWRRITIGIACCTFIIGGSISIATWLNIPHHYGVTGSSLFLLSSCFITLMGLTALIGTGVGRNIHRIARRYQTLHGWIGITTGSLLAMGFLAGALTLFAAPLQQWSIARLPPPSPLETSLLPLDKTTLDTLGVHTPLQYRITLTSPTTAQLSLPLAPELPLALPAAQILIHQTSPHTSSLYYLAPTPAPSFIGGLHRRMGLPLPEPWAMPIIGIICLFYGLALLSGVILLLPGMWRNLMTVRLHGRARRRWLDLHSLLGLCSMPFHLIIALTTALFAFFPLFCSISDTHIVSESKQNTHSLISPESVLTQLHTLAPHFQPYRLDYILSPITADTLAARVMLHAPLYSPNPLSSKPLQTYPSLFVQGIDTYNPMIGRDRASITLNPYTGSVLEETNLSSHQSLARRLLTWCLALHFGSFGGEFVRWLYIILALCGVGFFHTANQLWLNTHRKTIKKKSSRLESSMTLWLDRITEGSLMGCLLGLCGVIALSPLTTHLIPLGNITKMASLPSIAQTSMMRLYQHITLFYYTCFALSILSCATFPRYIYRVLILILSASFLTTALTIVTLRHTAMQNTATCSLTLALALATISLWASAGFILTKRMSFLPHLSVKDPPTPEA